MVLLAIAMLAIIAVIGLALDGGMAYSQTRQIQNSADSASIAGTSQLFRELFDTNHAADAGGTILQTVKNTASSNQGTVTNLECSIVGEPTSQGGTPPFLATCPTASALPEKGLLPVGAAGVQVTSRNSTRTSFMNSVGISSFRNVGYATALIETVIKLPTGASPLMACAVGSTDPNAAGSGITAGTTLGTYGGASQVEGPAILIGNPEAVNPLAVNQWYDLREPAGSGGVPRCGLSSGAGGMDWKGLVDQTGSYPMPGVWDGQNGDHGSNINQDIIAGGFGCTSIDSANGCLIAIPLCYADLSTPPAGYSFPLVCVTYGLFKLYAGPGSSRNVGQFLGGLGNTPTLTSGGSGGTTLPPPGGLAVIKLVR